MLSKIPRGRFVQVEEIAAMVSWLVSEENSFTSGGVFDLSGGRATYQVEANVFFGQGRFFEESGAATDLRQRGQIEENENCNGKFEVYNIHTNSVNNLDNFLILAKNKSNIQIIKHKTMSVFGISFHPEVRNEKIIYNFLKI